MNRLWALTWTTLISGRSSRFRGVTKHRWTGRFEAHLWDSASERKNVAPGGRQKGKQVYLGGYASEYEAARAYDKAAIKFWGDAAHLNFARDDYAGDLAEIKSLPTNALIAQLRRGVVHLRSHLSLNSYVFISLSTKFFDRIEHVHYLR